MTFPEHRARVALAALTASTMPWQSSTLTAALLAVCTAMSLLVDWHSRSNPATPTHQVPVVRIVCGDAEQTVELTWNAESARRRPQSGT
ncbi:hypothetical protein [Micromonospora humida]|uniref:Uncharacterized protein n=1 Tax=Micromonospora humida TaxID=2809018 RepID=A0ABS2IQ67_9ACTN|nr:hypothetical protein [Micromonospora humida]MBM7075421.1 hypothetical protein [Micromonospora humida]